MGQRPFLSIICTEKMRVSDANKYRILIDCFPLPLLRGIVCNDKG